LQIVVQPELCDLQFCMLEMIEGVAEMHEHEIGFMAEHRIKGALPVYVMLQPLQGGAGLGQDPAFLFFAQLAPLRPAETEHLVDNACSLKGKRNCMQFIRNHAFSLGRGYHLSRLCYCEL